MRTRQPMRRGFLRFYVLKLISQSEDGLSGYDLMKRIEEETGFWRPSPGSIYPLLASLEAAGRLVHQAVGDKKVYRLTAAGEEALAKARAVREEARAGIRRSMRVFSRLFDAQGEAPDPFSSPPPPDALPDPLRKPVRALHHLLAAVLSRRLSKAEANEIAEILKHTIEELRAHVQSD